MPVPILYLSAAGHLGGAELSLVELLRALDRDRYTPLLAVPQSGPEDLSQAARACGVDVHALPLDPVRRIGNPAALIKGLHGLRTAGRAVAALVRDTSAQIVHANTARAALSVALAPDGPSAPLLCHHRDLRLPWPMRGLLARRTAVAVAASDAVAEFLRGHAPAGGVHVVPSGVDLASFQALPDKAQARARLGLSSDPLLLAVGQPVAWKRHDLFVDTLIRVCAHLPGARGLVAVGSHADAVRAPLVDRLHREARARGLDEHAFSVRSFAHADMPTVYAAADALVHLAEREPFGRAVVEAMAAGLPVVAAHSGGPVTTLAHGGGRLVPVGDAPAAARAVRDCLADAALLADLRANRLARAAPFSAPATTRRIEGLYARLLTR